MVAAKTLQPRSYYLDTDIYATVRRDRRQLNSNPKEAKYVGGSPSPDPPEAIKDQPPVLAEKKEVLRSAQKSLLFQFPFLEPLLVPEEKSTRLRDKVLIRTGRILVISDSFRDRNT